MRANMIRTIGLTLVLGMGWSMTASATAVLALEIEDMIPMAPLVVVGEVNKIEASWNAEKTRIHTRAWITPSEVLKGEKNPGTVVVKTIGGQVGATVAVLPGAPRFEVGERVLVFLEPRKDGEGYLTIGFFQGKFKVFQDPKNGKELLLRDGPQKNVTVLNKSQVTPVATVRALADVRKLFVGGAK